MGCVERCHKLTSRHRNKYSNRKLDSTTEAYCEIAIAESNKRRRENPHSREQNVMEAFRSRMCAVVRARKEQEAAARAIDEARAEVGVVAGDSDDDTAPPNGFDDILNEVCEEAWYESDESDHEGAW
jgi:hypothetical protein